MVRTGSFEGSHCFTRAAHREFPSPQHASQPASPLDASSSMRRRATSGFFGQQDGGSTAPAAGAPPQAPREQGPVRTALPPRASMSQAGSPSCTASCPLPRRSSLAEQQQEPCSSSSSSHSHSLPLERAAAPVDEAMDAAVEEVAAEEEAAQQLSAPASPWADVPDDILRTILGNMPPAYVRVRARTLRLEL